MYKRQRYVEDAPSLMPSKGLVRNAAPSYMVLPGSKEPEEEGPVHFFILAGGSNMVGFGPVSKSDQEPDPRVVALSGQGEWVPAKEPLFAKYGLGPGKAFGERLANHYLKNKKYSSKRTPEERRRHREKKLRLKRLVEEKQKKLARVDAMVRNKLASKCPDINVVLSKGCLLYTSPSPRDRYISRMPSSA